MISWDIPPKDKIKQWSQMQREQSNERKLNIKWKNRGNNKDTKAAVQTTEAQK